MADADRPCPDCGAALPARRPRAASARAACCEPASAATPLSLSRAGELGATVDLAGRRASWRRSPRPSARCPASCSATPTPAAEPPVHRPGSPEMPGPPADGPPATGSSARSPAAAWAPCSRAATPTSAASWPSRCCWRSTATTPTLVRRFVEEAQIGGQLQHPGIVPIYELGAFADRRPYFAMKLVKGQTLAALLAARPSPADGLPRFLAIFEQVCQTVAYAHARGVIHRDLKPSNVMVGGFGEVQVMDWGLAKVLPRGGVADDATAGKVPSQETVIATARSGGDSDADLSRAGSVMGTPVVHGAGAGPRRGRRRSTSGPTSSRWARSSARSSPARPAFVGRDSGEIQRQAAPRRDGRGAGPAGRLRRRRRAGRPGQRLPGRRAGGPPARRRRRQRAGDGLPGRRPGAAARRRAGAGRGRGPGRRGAAAAAAPGRPGGVAAGAAALGGLASTTSSSSGRPRPAPASAPWPRRRPCCPTGPGGARRGRPLGARPRGRSARIGRGAAARRPRAGGAAAGGRGRARSPPRPTWPCSPGACGHPAVGTLAHDDLGTALGASGDLRRRRSPPTARRSAFSPTKPRPTTTSASPWALGRPARPSPRTARRSACGPTSPRPTTTSARPCTARGAGRGDRRQPRGDPAAARPREAHCNLGHALAGGGLRRGRPSSAGATSWARSGPAGATLGGMGPAGRADGGAGQPAPGGAGGGDRTGRRRRTAGPRPDGLRDEAVRRRRPALGRGAGVRPGARRTIAGPSTATTPPVPPPWPPPGRARTTRHPTTRRGRGSAAGPSAG